MARGLGTMQRLMLFRLACHEVQAAEAAAQRQQPYRSPDRWSLADLVYGLYRSSLDAVTARQRTRHGSELEKFRPERLRPELERFHPSRAILGLEQRRLVLRDRSRRHNNLALTPEGFAEARRLGGVPASKVVNLLRVQANWRHPNDFRLGVRFYDLAPRDDEISSEIHFRKRIPRLRPGTGAASARRYEEERPPASLE